MLSYLLPVTAIFEDVFEDPDSLKAAATVTADLLLDFLKEQDGEITRYDDGLTRRFIERITVRDSGFTVMLRSGIEVEIDQLKFAQFQDLFLR